MVFDVIAYVSLAALLIAAAVTDVRTGKVFNWLTYPAVLVGLAYCCLLYTSPSPRD